MRVHPGVLLETDRPEWAVLALCARTPPDPQNAAAVESLLQNRIDWTWLTRMAERHRITPLVYAGLNTAVPDAVPFDVLGSFRERVEAIARRNRAFTETLLDLLQMLDAAGIPAIPFKGPVLAALLYGDIALRQFADLDLLVRKRDARKARDLLCTAGFRPRGPIAEDVTSDDAARLRVGSNFSVTRPNDGVTVEIEWDIAPKSLFIPLQTDRLWDRVDSVSVLGANVPRLANEDLLLALCLNGTKKRWERLIWICDVAQLCRVRDIDWDRVFASASAVGYRRIVALGLLLATHLLGAPVPGTLLHRLEADTTARKLASQVAGRLMRDTDLPRDPLDRALFVLRARERTEDRARIFLYNVLVPTSEDQSLRLLPSFLSATRYLTRPVRLVRKYGTAPLRYLLGSHRRGAHRP